MASSEVSSKGNAAQAESLSSGYSDRNDADGGSRAVPVASGGNQGKFRRVCCFSGEYPARL